LYAELERIQREGADDSDYQFRAAAKTPEVSG
jgi:hypothetical protein